MKITNFRGDLTDDSAKKEALVMGPEQTGLDFVRNVHEQFANMGSPIIRRAGTKSE